MVKSLPSNAGDMGSIPGQGTKLPNAARLPSPRPTTTEPRQPLLQTLNALDPVCPFKKNTTCDSKDPECGNDDPTQSSKQIFKINKSNITPLQKLKKRTG